MHACSYSMNYLCDVFFKKVLILVFGYLMSKELHFDDLDPFLLGVL